MLRRTLDIQCKGVVMMTEQATDSPKQGKKVALGISGGILSTLGGVGLLLGLGLRQCGAFIEERNSSQGIAGEVLAPVLSAGGVAGVVTAGLVLGVGALLLYFALKKPTA